MPCVDKYALDYVDACRTRFTILVSAFEALSSTVGATDSRQRVAMAAFEPHVFNNMLVALDALDEPLRDVPIEVRIIRDTGDESNLEAITVFHLPPKPYPSGTVSFDHRFEQAGKFVGLVTAGEHQSRFPFSVAAGRSRLEPWLWAAAIIAGGIALFLFSERRRAA